MEQASDLCHYWCSKCISKAGVKEIIKAQPQSKHAESKKTYYVFHQLFGNSGFGQVSMFSLVLLGEMMIDRMMI
jgi:hypothetical protein